MKVYRMREVVEEVDIDEEIGSEALTQVLQGKGSVIGIQRDVVVDAWDPKEEEGLI